MKFMRIDKYLQFRYTDDSRPSKRTIIQHIRDGLLPGRKQGKFYYIDIEAEEHLTGNDLVDRVLCNE